MQANGTTGFYSDLNQLSNLRRRAASDPGSALTDVAAQFEALFISMMLESMRAAVPEDGLLGGDQMKTYQQMFDRQLATDLSAKGGIGLASIIEQQLQKYHKDNDGQNNVE